VNNLTVSPDTDGNLVPCDVHDVPNKRASVVLKLLLVAEINIRTSGIPTALCNWCLPALDICKDRKRVIRAELIIERVV
jgi:hypothetical protein